MNEPLLTVRDLLTLMLAGVLWTTVIILTVLGLYWAACAAIGV